MGHSAAGLIAHGLVRGATYAVGRDAARSAEHGGWLGMIVFVGIMFLLALVAVANRRR